MSRAVATPADAGGTTATPVIAAARAEATFVPGDPARAGRLALWHRDGTPGPLVSGGVALDGEVGPLDLLLPDADGRPAPVRATARFLPFADALPRLVAFHRDPTVAASMAAWVTAVRLGVGLVARGRLHPGITASALDTWRIGPLDADDEARLQALAAAMPTAAHALVVDGATDRLPTAEFLVRAAWDAVADTLARTAGAPRLTTGPAWAAPLPVAPPTDVAALTEWATLTSRGLDAATPTARAVLSVELPPDDRTAFRARLRLRSVDDPTEVRDAEDVWGATDGLPSAFGSDPAADLLVAIHRGAQVWPPLARAAAGGRPTVVELTDSDALELFGPTGDDLAAAGFDVEWPTDVVVAPVELEAVVDAEPQHLGMRTGIDLGALLDVRWEASLAGQALTPEELHHLAEATRPLVRLRDQWVAADPSLRDRLRQGPSRLRTADVLGAALGGASVVEHEAIAVRIDGVLGDLATRLRDLDPQRELAEPAGLTGTLRPYQRRGLAWLAEMAGLGLGGCLADDMGLGKTIQVIALHLHRHQSGADRPTLVVCPASLLGTWERELNRFAPGVPVRRYHGSDRHLDDLQPSEVVLVTYGVLARDRTPLAATTWDLVVADEAQHAKNPYARTARELRHIPAAARIALTGTPVENHLSELWSILDWTTPGLLGPLETYRRTIAMPIERTGDPDATERLAKLVRPFLLRRRKSDPGIAPELPPKTETDHLVPLTTEQAALYEAVTREVLSSIADADGIARRGLVLKLLTGLKQVSDHPALYLHETEPIAGRSGKLAALDELLDTIVDAGDSTLVFTQYVTMGRLLEAHLHARGIRTVFLHGSVPVPARQALIDRFQDGEVPVFLLSLRAGGTGLNLTRATHVVHYDRWWNPAVEDQATDRAHRIGQTRAVQVHRLIAEGTIEDRIAVLLEKKRSLAESVVGGGEGWITELSDEELADLVSLRTTGVTV